jgi:type VI secretion system secreted protein Hcp
MPLRLYAQIRFARQGLVKGTGTGARADWIPLADVSYDLAAAIDESNGSPLGHRIHKPIELTAPVGAYTPQLIAALTSNEVATSWIVEYDEVNSSGREATVLRISGSQGTVATCDLGTDQSGEQLVNYFSLSYQGITVEWLDGGITAQDNWLTPGA